jgi:hypothetical protein
MSERVNRKRSLVTGLASGLVGGLAGFALCVFLSRSADEGRNVQSVRAITITQLPSASAPRLSDAPTSHTLTAGDLSRCQNVLLGGVLPEPTVPGVATVASPAPAKTPYTDDDLRQCISSLTSLAGVGNGQ